MTSSLIFLILSLILPVRHPSRGVEQAVYVRVCSLREKQGGRCTRGVINSEMIFKSMRLCEITQKWSCS